MNVLNRKLRILIVGTSLSFLTACGVSGNQAAPAPVVPTPTALKQPANAGTGTDRMEAAGAGSLIQPQILNMVDQNGIRYVSMSELAQSLNYLDISAPMLIFRSAAAGTLSSSAGLASVV